MREFKWDRGTITPNEIAAELAKQYGFDQPISVNIEQRNTQISLKSTTIPLECHRCGEQFSLTPYTTLNRWYLRTPICKNCGNMTDEQLKEWKKKRMLERGTEILEERGEDVTEKGLNQLSEEDEKKAKEIAEDKKISEEIDYSDAFDEIESEEEPIQEEPIQEEPIKEENQETLEENSVVSQENYSENNDYEEQVDDTEENDQSEEILDDSNIGEIYTEEEFENKLSEEYNRGISEATSKYEEQLEEMKNELNKSSESHNETLKAMNDKFSEEKAECIKQAKEEAMKEASIKAQEEQAKIRDEIEEKHAKELEALKKQYENQINQIKASNDAKLEKEKADANAKLEKAIKAQEAAEKYAAEMNLKAFEKENESISEETIEHKEPKKIIPTIEDIKEAKEYVERVVLSKPWSKIGLDMNDGIQAICKCCGNGIEYDDLDDLKTIIKIDDTFCENYGLEKDLKNNIDGSTPMIANCPTCIKDIIENGAISVHKNAVLRFAENSHFEIVDKDKHLFIPNMKESFKIRCNGIETDEIKFTDLYAEFNGKDARESERFRVEKDVKSTESTKIEEEVTKIKVTPPDNEKTNQATNNSHIQNDGTVKIKISKSAVESSSEQNDRKTASSKSQADLSNDSFDEIREKYASKVYSEASNDTNAKFEEERKFEEEEIKSKSVFKLDPKLVLGKKKIAELNGKTNPFQRSKALEDSFNESVFARFIDDLSNESGVAYHLTIDGRTLEFPVIDFETGYRIICADLNDRSVPNVQYGYLMNKDRLPFYYYESTATDDGDGVLRKHRKSFTPMILYSDSVIERRDATFQALMKYINPTKLAYQGKAVVLEGNFPIEYTTYDQFLRDFDVRYSTFPAGKPKTGQLGILAQFVSNKKEEVKDVLKFQLQLQSSGNVANLDNLEENAQYMVASIRYIERYNKETNRVVYTITDYVEIGSSIIADGLYQCIKALLKEYTLKYPQMAAIEPYIIVECDSNTFMSPSVKNYIEKGSLVKMDNAYSVIINGSSARIGKGVDVHLRYSYIRRPEYRTKISDAFRHDTRVFSAGTLIKTMADEIKQAGIQNTIFDQEVKNRFIANMGFVKANQIEIKEMVVNAAVVSNILFNGETLRMIKHIDADSGMYQISNMVTNSNIGMGMNNLFTNPALMNKFNRILNSGTNEAKQYLFNTMYQTNPVMAAQMSNYTQMAGNMQNPMMCMYPGFMGSMGNKQF